MKEPGHCRRATAMAEGARIAMDTCTKRHAGSTSCYTSAMPGLDLNLLATLDVLLSEGSVAGAARRLQLSASAMSRALARLREVTGDPLLVRAGRGLVPTPRALELRDRVRRVVDDAETVLRPALKLDLSALARSFSVRSSEGFVETFGPALIARTTHEASGVRLCFVPKADKDSTPLRDGSVDLETGVIDATMGPEIRTVGLFTDRHVGVVRRQHPLSRGAVTPARYAAGPHVLVTRRGLGTGDIDQRLLELGLERDVRVAVGGFATAIALARNTDLVATVPERHTRTLCEGMCVFALPFEVPAFTVSMCWHPRMDADPAHRWLRALVRDVCGDGAATGSTRA